MASIRTRTSAAGVTTYAVLFRRGTRQTSETFVNLKGDRSAEWFKGLVELLGPDKALAELNGGDQAHALTVDELAEKFFEWKKGDVDARTIDDYRRDYDNWIKPTLGHRRADGVDELDVQKWVDGMTGRLEPKSVGDRHMILHSMFKFGCAKVRRLVDHNPCTETQMPKRTKKPPKGMPLPAWFAIRETCRKPEPDALDLAEFIVGVGWRFSEATALTVAMVEEYTDQDGTDLVVATMRKVTRKGQSVDAAKSYAGFRRSKIPDPAAGIVLRRIVGKGPDDLVFTNSQGGKWFQQNFLNRTWPRMLRLAGLDDTPGKRYTPHHLRHTQPMVLNRAGATMPEMQRRMGHESINTTINVYGGLIDDISNETLANMSTILSGQKPKGQIVQGTVVEPDVVKGELVSQTAAG